MADLVDYSTTANADWAGLARTLKAAGKVGIVRYAVSDKSPNGRGITAVEYQAMTDAGIDVGLYWEGHAAWMLDGYAAGVAAAQNAMSNIIGAGMPVRMPIYFAHDIDPETQHFAAIDDTLRGCASVVGWERCGVYGGWLLMDYMAGGGTIKWLAQTSAWEYGRGVHPSATIYQFAYNQYFYGTNCDLVRSLRAEWGQASSFVSSTPLPQVPGPGDVVTLPEGIDWDLVSKYFGTGDLYRPGKPAGKFKLHKGRPWAKAYLDRAIKEQVWPQVDAWHQYKDSPTATREIITFRNGWTLMRLNDLSPWKWV